MDEKKQIHNIITHIWELMKPYLSNAPQTQAEWQSLIRKENEFRLNNPLDEKLSLLEFLMFNAMSTYYINVSQNLDDIRKEIASCNEASSTISAGDAWEMVYKAICNSNYHADEEFSKLPALVQKAVGSPSDLRTCARMNTVDIQTTYKNQFMRTFSAYIKNSRMVI